MTQEQNQPKLEDMLLSIASLTDVSKKIGKSKTPQEQADLYETVAKMLSGGNRKNYNLAIEQLTRNPAYAVMQTEGARDNLARSVEEQYESERFEIARSVESRINETLKEAGDNKSTASMLLAQYLIDILDVPEYTQEEVDEIERNQIYSMGMPYAFGTRGSIGQYKNIKLKKQASEYLKEVKNGDKLVRYSIDKEKLREAMKDVVIGSSIYGRTEAMTKAIEKAKVEKAKKK